MNYQEYDSDYEVDLQLNSSVEGGYSADDYYYYTGYDVYFEVGDAIVIYYTPILIVLGTILNISVIVTSLRLHAGGQVMSSYLGLMAVADTLLLFVSSGNYWLTHVSFNLTESILSSSDTACKTYSFAIACLKQLDTWMAVIFFIHLVVNEVRVCGYRQSRENSDRVLHLSLLAVLGAVLTNTHLFWTYSIVQPYDEKWCSFTSGGSDYGEHFQKDLSPIVNDLAVLILPSAVVVGCMVYIMKKLSVVIRYITSLKDCDEEQLTGSSEMAGNDTTSSAVHKDDMIDRKCLLIISIALGVGLVTVCLLEFGYNLYEYWLERSAVDGVVEYSSRRHLTSVVIHVISDTYLALKFIVYMIVWGRLRFAFLNCLKACKCKNVTDANIHANRIL